MSTYTILACGFCTDGMVYYGLPFIFYWMILFALWTIIIGNIPYMRTITDEELAPPPAKSFGLYVLILVILVIPTAASLTIPFILVSLHWIANVIKFSTDKTPSLNRKYNRILLFILLIFIPLSYINPLPELADRYL